MKTLKEAIQEKMSISAFAKKTKISRRMIYYIIDGTYPANKRQIKQMAIALEVEPKSIEEMLKNK